MPSILRSSNRISFHNGVLQITNGLESTRIKPWPPVAWRKPSSDSCWRRCRCLLSLDELHSESRKTIWSSDSRYAVQSWAPEALGGPLLPFTTDTSDACKQFLECIPPAILHMARQYGTRQCAVLEFLSRAGTAGFELAESGNQALVFMLANPVRILGRFLATDEIQSLLRRRRRGIVEFMGFPSVAVNLLKKVDPSQLTISQCLKLRTLLWRCQTDGALAKMLFHLPKVNRAIVRIVSSPNLLELVEPKFVRTIASDMDDQSVVTMLIRVAKMLTWPGIQRHGLSCFSSGRHIERFVEELGPEAWVAQQMAVEYGRQIPAPPLPGISGPPVWIEPLASLEAIIAEGRAQRLCLRQAAHVPEVAAGAAYIYSVRTHAGDRATLLIEKATDCWRIGNVAASSNRAPSVSVLHACQQWLADCQGQESIPF